MAMLRRTGCALALLGFEFRGQPRLLVGSEPTRLRRPVAQIEPRDDADDDRRNRDAEEHHAPAGQAEQSMRFDQQRGERRADHDRQRLREIEQREDMAAMALRHPHAQEQDRTGKEARFRHTQQKAQPIQPRHAAHPREEQRDDAPRHHDSREPAARTELVQREVARHFEKDVADEKHARRETELGGVQPQILRHAVRSSERDRRAIEEVDEEHQRDERHEAQRNLADGRALKLARACLFGVRGSLHCVSSDGSHGSALLHRSLMFCAGVMSRPSRLKKRHWVYYQHLSAVHWRVGAPSLWARGGGVRDLRAGACRGTQLGSGK